MVEPVILNNRALEAKINPENAQLYSLKIIDANREVMWPGGSPDYEGAGWKDSSPVMHPTPGPVISGKLEVEGKEFSAVQHGGSRYGKWLESYKNLENDIRQSVAFTQIYRSGDIISTPKGKAGFPYHFKLITSFHLISDLVDVVHTLSNLETERSMFAGMGYHPAFLKDPSKDYEIICRDYEIGKIGPEILTSDVNLYKGAEIILFKKGDLEIGLTSNIGNAIVWDPKPEARKGDLIALEFVTGINLAEEKELAKRNGMIKLDPHQIKQFGITIQPRIIA